MMIMMMTMKLIVVQKVICEQVKMKMRILQKMEYPTQTDGVDVLWDRIQEKVLKATSNKHIVLQMDPK